MVNKLGIIDEEELKKIEEQLIKVKMSLLNYQYTFNELGYSFNYLIKLHSYLFGDIYYLENNNLNPRITMNEESRINILIQKLIDLGINNDCNIEEISNIFYELWELQIFNDGNTRTLVAFLNIYIEAFKLDIVFDYYNIISGTGIFDIENFSSKKR